MAKDPFTHQIIGLAMKVHRDLGPGLNEEFYHQHLVGNLIQGGIEHLSKPRRDLLYRGHVADTFEADLVFPAKLIPELKALRGNFDGEHFTQVLSYCKFWRIKTGMLFDFGKASLIQKRVAYASRMAEFPDVGMPSFVSNKDLATRLIGLAQQCIVDIGLGYRPTTWCGLMIAAMRDTKLPFDLNPQATVTKLGTANLPCIRVYDEAAIYISALGDQVTAMDRSHLQTCLKWLNLPWGICFHFGKEAADLKFISNPERK